VVFQEDFSNLSPSSNPLLLLVVGYALQVLQRWSFWLLLVVVLVGVFLVVVVTAVVGQVVLEPEQGLVLLRAPLTQLQ
jgi:hypothetical protein